MFSSFVSFLLIILGRNLAPPNTAPPSCGTNNAIIATVPSSTKPVKTAKAIADKIFRRLTQSPLSGRVTRMALPVAPATVCLPMSLVLRPNLFLKPSAANLARMMQQVARRMDQLFPRPQAGQTRTLPSTAQDEAASLVARLRKAPAPVMPPLPPLWTRPNVRSSSLPAKNVARPHHRNMRGLLPLPLLKSNRRLILKLSC